eukprot:scaffold681435_cov57-Prasinocladus_malaysianus.AAC.1
MARTTCHGPGTRMDAIRHTTRGDSFTEGVVARPWLCCPSHPTKAAHPLVCGSSAATADLLDSQG